MHAFATRFARRSRDRAADDELTRLLATFERGTAFEDRRDAALIRVFIDTGALRSEVAGLCASSVKAAATGS